MQFNSFVFILAFMPIITAAYFLANRVNAALGKLVLFVGSVVFYAYSDRTALAVLGISLLLNYVFARLITGKEKWKKYFLFFPVCVNVGLLLYFKYTDFAIANVNAWFGKNIALRELALPVGISFFTFAQIAYLVAVFNKELENTGLLDYLLYILYFPKILMGPLMEPEDFIRQINASDLKRIDWDNLAFGVRIFSFGLFKKALLADTFSGAVAWGYDNFGTATAADWALIMLFYTMEIYFDFSGYTDMAVGASRMLNITLPINFDSPYKAASIRDFWKRWHISLTKFFTKYLYIPLGGNRKGTAFTCFNTMLVFLVSGIWHGANWTFILWGALHGALSLFDRSLERLEKKLFEPLRWLLTFAVLNVLWLLFRSDSIRQWLAILKTVVSLNSTVISDGLLELFSIQEASFLCNTFGAIDFLSNKIHGFWMYLFLTASCVICFVPENNYRAQNKYSIFSMAFAAAAFAWGLICLSRESVFVYFNF